jgi:hypothetical protein
MQDNENLEGAADTLHEEILAEGHERFPEESYRQLLAAGATSEEALEMLGYSAASAALPLRYRRRLVDFDDQNARR